MTKRERVAASLRGAEVDRVPMSFWHHFGGNEVGWSSMARAHAEFFEKFDLDFIMVMNDNPYVDSNAGPIQSASDFRKLGSVDLAKTAMAPAVGGVRDLREMVGNDVMMICTIFGSFSAVDKLSGRRGAEVIPEDPESIREGLKSISESLARFAADIIEAGADGIFLAAQSSKGVLPDGLYEDLIHPCDVTICEGAAAGAFNMAHICGKENDFDLLCNLPVHALNWADRTAGPTIPEARQKTDKCLVAGIDHSRLFTDEFTLDDLRSEARDAMGQGGKTKYIFAAGCSVPNDVPAEVLETLRDEARAG